jgi:hypothetical protein
MIRLFLGGIFKLQNITNIYENKKMQNTKEQKNNFSFYSNNRLLYAVNTNQGDNTYSIFNTYDRDGNFVTLKRYGDNNTVTDGFQYQYFPNTNKVRLVSGAIDQFNFDQNGNTKLDDINGNYDIK